MSRTIVFHKPYDVLPCFKDPDGRPTLADYITVPGVYAAGRLDRDSEGLMILTSDGALVHRITDPLHKLPKVYWAQVERVPAEGALNQMRMTAAVGHPTLRLIRVAIGAIRLDNLEPGQWRDASSAELRTLCHQPRLEAPAHASKRR